MAKAAAHWKITSVQPGVVAITSVRPGVAAILTFICFVLTLRGNSICEQFAQSVGLLCYSRCAAAKHPWEVKIDCSMVGKENSCWEHFDPQSLGAVARKKIKPRISSECLKHFFGKPAHKEW
ncbi:unnamed protein product [Polarella glacialis]|uniref:Uncharacterized protein n=1 Tax=Polarella glacialis TaxID=89957 RepID=A0A813HZB8_POLGL|nr:unnamed protein product [Polarella glacialis]